MGFRRLITVERTCVGEIGDDGYYVQGRTTSISVYASIQPLGTNEYTQLGIDGERNIKYVKVYTKNRLYTASNPQQAQADVIIWQGTRYKVIQCDAYQMGVISHYKAIAQEVTAHDE